MDAIWMTSLMNKPLLAASGLSLLTLCAHIFLGGPAIHDAILESDASDRARCVSSVVWHATSAILFINAVAFLYSSRRQAPASPAVALIAAQYLAFAALFIGYGIARFSSLFSMPQWIAFLAISCLSLWGNAPIRARRRASDRSRTAGGPSDALAANNIPLIVGAGVSVIVSLLHIFIIFGGAPWYRFFGAGERMAAAAAAGLWYPMSIAAGVAFVFAFWGVYALSGAGVFRRLPMLKPALCIITVLYALRGLAALPQIVSEHGGISVFHIWIVLICLGCGAVHLLGVIQVWKRL